MTPLERITARVNRHGDVNLRTTPAPLLTLEEFFDGNEVVGSICCNLDPTPAPADVRKVLEGIRSRPDVADVRVQVTLFDVPEWPFSDTVWVITSAAEPEIDGLFGEDLAPSECGQGWVKGVAYEHLDVPEGMHPIGCWWD